MSFVSRSTLVCLIHVCLSIFLLAYHDLFIPFLHPIFTWYLSLNLTSECFAISSFLITSFQVADSRESPSNPYPLLILFFLNHSSTKSYMYIYEYMPSIIIYLCLVFHSTVIIVFYLEYLSCSNCNRDINGDWSC